LPASLRARPPVPTVGTTDPARVDVTAVLDDLLARGETNLHARVLAVVERALFKRILSETGGHLGQAAERLGLNRSTLRYKLRELGLSVERVVGE
jgi:two-component system nitrogen regulation response regulator GlnG